MKSFLIALFVLFIPFSLVSESEKGSMPSIPLIFPNNYEFLEDVLIDARDAYTYFETLKETIEKIRQERLITELYPWVLIDPNISIVTFVIPMKNYEELGKIQHKWMDIKKKYPSIAPGIVNSYTIKLRLDLSYPVGIFHEVEYDLIVEVKPENISEFEGHIKKLISILKEKRADFNFVVYSFMMGVQPRYILSWTGVSSEDMYASFESLPEAQMLMLRIIGLSDVNSQVIGQYKPQYMISID